MGSELLASIPMSQNLSGGEIFDEPEAQTVTTKRKRKVETAETE